jgi:phenylalanine-4-hydroxylase
MKRPTVLEKLPKYLHPFVATQDASLYTAIDHASWRYIMKVSKNFFSTKAHQKYLDGLEDTGISTDRIPLISEMDEKLSLFGWRAVPIIGFIPSEVFLEFLSLGVLPIACDMRKLENIAYTPAPDIVHEAAGHAPIIADPEYADYLHQYGEVARKVIFSSEDQGLYDAIRFLSDTKEDPLASRATLEAAQKGFENAVKNISYVSEATELARMAWWTIEYGLVGTLENPKIYGAGLLSSVSESYHCLSDKVKKIPFSIDCIKQSYDITKPQPQLFVTPNFEKLSQVLEEYSNTMAYKKGGVEGLNKGIRAKTVVTVELDSGVQISGVLENFIENKQKPIYLKFSGPSQLSYRDLEFEGQGVSRHQDGYSAVLGSLKKYSKPIHLCSKSELEKLQGVFEFDSGVLLTGKIKNIIGEDDVMQIITFANCTVQYHEKVLYRPEWGEFDLACGEKVCSVFGGPADRSKFLNATGGFKQIPNKPKTNLTRENKSLVDHYQEIKNQRVEKNFDKNKCKKILEELNTTHTDDWLLCLEILELVNDDDSSIVALAKKHLEKFKNNQNLRELIVRGIEAYQLSKLRVF